MSNGTYESIKRLLSTISQKYTSFITADIQQTTQAEYIVKTISYIVTLGQSDLISELTFSLSNLIVFFNDYILLSVLKKLKTSTTSHSTFCSTFVNLLTIVEHIQVSIELIADKVFKGRGKWLAVSFICLFKSLLRSILIYYYRSGLMHTQAGKPLDREKFSTLLHETSEDINGNKVENGRYHTTNAWVGSRTGKVIRSIHDDSKLAYEELDPQREKSLSCVDTTWSEIAGANLAGETLYITKPIAHLVTMFTFGHQSLVSWLIPLAIDLSSIYLMGMRKLPLKPYENREITGRKFGLIYYLLRSPIYDSYVKIRLLSFLGFLAKKLPIIGRIFEQLMLYLPKWQRTYFHVWAT